MDKKLEETKEEGMEQYYFIALLVSVILIIIKIIEYDIKNYRLKKKYEEEMKKRGTEGETATAYYLNKVKGFKKLVFNVYLPKSFERDADTVEVDIIMIHEKGIFVVENKNYNGSIYGGEEDWKWSLISKNRKKYLFYNPIKQNQSHIKYVKKILKDTVGDHIPYSSVITFNEGACLKDIKIYSEDILVTNSTKVRRLLKKRLRFRQKVLSRKQIEEISVILKEYTQVSRKIQKEHIKYVKKC